MLVEYKKVSQPSGDPGFRRWFSDVEMDLIVWYRKTGEVNGFQLCYDRNRERKAFTWHSADGFSHVFIDDSNGGLTKASPMLAGKAPMDVSRVTAEFLEKSDEIEPDLTRLVELKLKEYESRGRT